MDGTGRSCVSVEKRLKDHLIKPNELNHWAALIQPLAFMRENLHDYALRGGKDLHARIAL